MSVTLEWVCMPNGILLRTICRNGVPIPEPTRYLLSRAFPDVSSTCAVRTYAQHLRPLFVWLDRRDLALTDVTVEHLRQFRGNLTLHDVDSPPLLRAGADSKPATIYQTLAATVRFFEWAMEPEDCEPLVRPRGVVRRPRRRVPFARLQPDVAAEIRQDLLPRMKRTLPQFLSLDQLETCRTWVMETFAFDPALQVRNRAILEVMWDGALRAGALLGLRRDRINWHDRTVTVSFDPRDYRDEWFRKAPFGRSAKTGEQVVQLADTTVQWLNRYWIKARPPRAVELRHGLFFCMHRLGTAKHGEPLTPHALRYLFTSLSRPESEGGVGFHVHPHMLRHTWAAMALDDGAPIETVQHHLGHADINTTLGYGHISPERMREDKRRWRDAQSARFGPLT